MKTKFGAIIVDGRGKLGGHVASKNRHGSYLRTKVSPAQPSSTYSANVRSRLSSISQSWRGLLESARTLWNNAVADFKSTDIFGDIKNPSGFNLYQMLNNNLVNTGTAMITTPPQPVAVGTFDTLSHVDDNSSNSVIVSFTVGGVAAIPAGHKALLFATEAISGGKNFVKSELRQIAVLAPADTSPYTASTVYNAKFGAVGSVGKKIVIGMKLINTTTGQAGHMVQAASIIVA